MGRKRSYSPEFREQAVELYRLDDDATYADVARDLDCSPESIRQWVRQADIDEGVRTDGPTTDHKARLRELEAENRRLRRVRRPG